MAIPTPPVACHSQAPQRGQITPRWHFGVFILGCAITAAVNFVALPRYLPLKLSLRPAALIILGSTACSEIALVAILLLLSGGARSRDLRLPGSRSCSDTVPGSAGPNQVLAPWGGGRPAPAPALRLGLLLAMGLAVAVAITCPIVRVYAFEASGFRAAAMLLAALGAGCEEVLFRGYAGSALARGALPARGQVGASALLYALFRGLPWGLTWGLAGGLAGGLTSAGSFHQPPPLALATGMALGLLLALPLGMGWAMLYQASSRSLTPCVSSHVLFNLLVEPWATLWLVHLATRNYAGPLF